MELLRKWKRVTSHRARDNVDEAGAYIVRRNRNTIRDVLASKLKSDRVSFPMYNCQIRSCTKRRKEGEGGVRGTSQGGFRERTSSLKEKS